MNPHATQIIKALGDTAAVARLFGIAMSSVSDWKQLGIPPARLMYLKAVHKKKLAGIDFDAAVTRRQQLARKPRTPKPQTPATAGEASHA